MISRDDNPLRYGAFLILLISLLLLVGVALAQSNMSYNLAWYTVDGGGWTSNGSRYSLRGALGQPDAGRLSDDGYTLIGGFWGGEVIKKAIYLPMVSHP
jgi:hypothetical protein